MGTPAVFFAVLLMYFCSLGLILSATLVASFNIIRGSSPRVINAFYRMKNLNPSDSSRFHAIVERLNRKPEIRMSKLGVINIPSKRFCLCLFGCWHLRGRDHQIAWHTGGSGSSFGPRALTLEAVQIMMLVFFPSLSRLHHKQFSVILHVLRKQMRRGRRSSNPHRDGQHSSDWALLLLAQSLSRLRGYNVDRHSASVVDEGPRKLSEGLEIVSKTGRM